MPDLKLHPLLKAIQPEHLRDALEPFFGPGSRPELEGTRLDPPTCMWASYRLGNRWVTLKSYFAEADYSDYVARLRRRRGEHFGDPHHPRGGLVVHPELNAVLWGFPFDPSMPALAMSADGAWVAEVLRRRSPQPLAVDVLRYRPEIGALLAYRDPRTGRTLAYGKAVPRSEIGLVWLVMDHLWQSPLRSLVRLARPLAYRPQAGLMLQAPVGGAPLDGHRNRQRFMQLAETAGAALASIHAADIPYGPERTVERLLQRLDDALETIAFSAPRLYQPLRRLTTQIRERAERASPAPAIPSHGDYKWDQFLYWRGSFALIDFELFCQAERAYDLGYFCAYLPPSRPRNWQEAAAAEMLRGALLEAYARASGSPVDLERVALHEAAMLAIRALSHVWRQGSSSWSLRASQLIDLAFERLVDPEPKSIAVG
jgi:hypothetical protein